MEVLTNNSETENEQKPATVKRGVDRPVDRGVNQDEVMQRLLDLENKTGYSIKQRHGQRIYGDPPPGWEGPKPGRGTEVYCYKIPRG